MFNAISTLLHRCTHGPEREAILALRQPVTATQLGHRLGIRSTQSSALLARLNEIGLVRPLNPFARASRVYFSTTIGQLFHDAVATAAGCPTLPKPPKLNYTLYGSLCFSHRATVLKTLTRPLQPAAIKRVAFRNDPTLQMNAANVRDVIRFLGSHGLVEPVFRRKKAHPQYRVTDQGMAYQQLLQQAEVMR